MLLQKNHYHHQLKLFINQNNTKIILYIDDIFYYFNHILSKSKRLFIKIILITKKIRGLFRSTIILNHTNCLVSSK